MDIKEIRETPIWLLYEKGRNYHRMVGIYTDTDKNYRMYNGNQWDGAKLGGVEPIQENIIRPIVDYKVAVIHDSLYAINYSSMNYESQQFQKEASEYCKMLNGYAAKVWEQDNMDVKCRRVTLRAAVNDEGIVYVDFDKENMTPVNEIVKKNDIYYGNENDDDIQAQPYILMRKRMPRLNAIDLAHALGCTNKDDYIIGDNDTFEESGEAAKKELDDMVTIVYKLYKEKGTVRFAVATRWVELAKDMDTGLSLYPIAHFIWAEKEGSARGEGEVRNLIPNQIEINKTLTRRALVAKLQAYPKTVADRSKISNPNALDTVGGTIWTTGQTVDDVRKVVGTLPPAQISPDVQLLLTDLVDKTRELAGASDAATGQINPEDASGRAILAVQNANRVPIAPKKVAHKGFVEDLAKIWLEYLIVHSEDGVALEKKVTTPEGEEYYEVVRVPQALLKKLQASVKVDVTPKSEYDKLAQEQTLENLLLNGLLNPQRLPEFKAYVEALDDDAGAPKRKMQEIIERMEKEQQKIAMIQARMNLMQQRTQQFIAGDPEGQASMISDAKAELEGEAVNPENPDDN